MKKQQLAKRGKILMGWSICECIAGCLIYFVFNAKMNAEPSWWMLLSFQYLIYGIFMMLGIGLIGAGIFGVFSGLSVLKASGEDEEGARFQLNFAMVWLVIDAFGPFVVFLFIWPEISLAVLVRGLIIFFCFRGFRNFRDMKDEPEDSAKSSESLLASDKSEEPGFTKTVQEGD